MSYDIQIYRGKAREYFGTMPFLQVVRDSLEELYHWRLPDASLRVMLIKVPQETLLNGTPVVENLVPDFGYAYVKVVSNGQIIYQHPHPLDDIVTARLQSELRKRVPEENCWSYRINVPGMPERSTIRLAPPVEGIVAVRPYEAGEKPRFAVKRLDDESLPAARLADFGIKGTDAERRARVKVLIPRSLQTELIQARKLSLEVEEGGFLVGYAHQEGDETGSHILMITGALDAEFTGASLLHFTFTGDSFAAVKKSLREQRPGERILGWYHTHLFPATESMGLSSIDLKLHFSTFTFSWQVAGLINFDTSEGTERTLRFYYREGNEMKLAPHWAVEEKA